jgi:protein-S-isoprenylcysteine O-methyltransferase Ste14
MPYLNEKSDMTTHNSQPANPADAKKRSVFERLRKPASRLAAVAIVALAVFAPPKYHNSVTEELIFEMPGFILLMLAALGRIWCGVYIAGRKDRVLCTDGPYSLTRNPLYFFSFLGVAGFFYALHNLPVLALAVLLFLGYYHFVIKSEERRLSVLFGDDYSQYIQSTPRFFPAFRAMRGKETCTIQPKIIERSLCEVAWFLLAIIFIEVVDMLSPLPT